VGQAGDKKLALDAVFGRVVLKVLGQLKVAPCGQGPVVASALEAFGAGLKLFQAQGGQVVAGANVGKGQGAGVFKHFHGQHFGALHPVGGLFAVQGEAGLFEVKALHGHFGGLQAALAVPLVDGVDAFFDVAALEADLGGGFDGLGLGGGVVANDQGVDATT
jgi:hypothetical protein